MELLVHGLQRLPRVLCELCGRLQHDPSARALELTSPKEFHSSKTPTFHASAAESEKWALLGYHDAYLGAWALLRVTAVAKLRKLRRKLQ